MLHILVNNWHFLSLSYWPSSYKKRDFLPLRLHPSLSPFSRATTQRSWPSVLSILGLQTLLFLWLLCYSVCHAPISNCVVLPSILFPVKYSHAACLSGRDSGRRHLLCPPQPLIYSASIHFHLLVLSTVGFHGEQDHLALLS